MLSHLLLPQISPEEFKKIMEEKVEMDAPPWDPPEISRVQPAPDWGPKIQAHFDRFQWILFLLRKAHLQPGPCSPAEALISAGMLFFNFCAGSLAG